MAMSVQSQQMEKVDGFGLLQTLCQRGVVEERQPAVKDPGIKIGGIGSKVFHVGIVAEGGHPMRGERVGEHGDDVRRAQAPGMRGVMKDTGKSNEKRRERREERLRVKVYGITLPASGDGTDVFIDPPQEGHMAWARLGGDTGVAGEGEVSREQRVESRE